LTALSFLHREHKGKPDLLGIGPAGIWATFAAAVTPIELNLHSEMKTFHGTDDEFLGLFNVPGIQRAGGLAAAETILAGK
jgi:hypothetical protein